VLTEDGRRLALHRLRPGRSGRRHPVVCCHGLGANRLAFDVDPEVSLARVLSALGYDVFLLELRGHGLSERPPFGWAFDDYLREDVPAAIARACELSGAAEVHWIGHSMGGLLAYAHLSRGAGGMRSAITVGSALDYSQSASGFHRLVPLGGVMSALPALPVSAIARAASILVGRVRTPYEAFNVARDSCAPRHWKTLCARGFHAVSMPVMDQLKSAMQPGGLRSLDGVAYIDALGDATTPLLALCGSADPQCPPEAAAHTVARMPRGELRVLEGYGHFDLLIGHRVHDEVFPLISAWLERHDP
jgi:alpha-beta hydrolase superfamily lysophospholipase